MLIIHGKGRFFYLDPGQGEIILCATAQEAQDGAECVIADANEGSGWMLDEDDLGAILWGEIKERAQVEATKRPPDSELDEDGLDNQGRDWKQGDIDEWWDVDLKPIDVDGKQ